MTHQGSGLTKIVTLKFHLSCIPPKTSHHAKRIVRIGQFSRLADKPELVSAKQMLDALLLPHQPPAPIPGPVVLEVVNPRPWLASHSKRARAAGRLPHTSKPDLDNVTKSLTDRLKALRFIEDDQAVVELRARKWWSSTPGIEIMIHPWEPHSLLSATEARVVPDRQERGDEAMEKNSFTGGSDEEGV